MTPDPLEDAELEPRGGEDGARHSKGRGEWVEIEKVGEALEWLRAKGRDERLLTDFGIGVM